MSNRKIDIAFAVMFGLCALMSIVGVLAGATHLLVMFAISTVICIASIIEIIRDFKK